MNELLNNTKETTRKNESRILQGLSKIGQTNVAKALGTSEATVSRMKDGEISKFAAFLAACGLKVTNINSLQIERDELTSMEVFAYKYLEQKIELQKQLSYAESQLEQRSKT